jgi:hypothetical protein
MTTRPDSGIGKGVNMRKRRFRDWLDRWGPSWLLGIYDWPGYRLFGECWAQDCPVPNRRNIRHTPNQLLRCAMTPMAISLTERGWLYGEGIDPDSVVPASRASA